MENSHLAHESVEDALISAVGCVKRFAGESIQQTEAYTRESPAKAIACSVGIGYLISFLPIGGLIAVTVRLVLRLVRPALMILSLAKVYELVSAGCKQPSANKAEL